MLANIATDMSVDDAAAIHAGEVMLLTVLWVKAFVGS